MHDDTLPRVLPALTPAQRAHLDIFGYVLVERLLGTDQVARLLDRLLAIEDDFRAHGAMPAGVQALFSSTPHYFRIDNLPHVDPGFLDYVAHPRLLGMVEEAIGGEARLEQSDAHIRRSPDEPTQQRYGFHRGSRAVFPYEIKGRYHFPFVKTLTNLTDLGVDDGGTTVIPGSHKLLGVDEQELIAAAMQDPALIHHVVAPAGSTLLFFESLVHCSGIIRSGRACALIIGGYTPTMYQAYEGYDPDPEFLTRCPSRYHPLLSGQKRWKWAPQVASLGSVGAASS